MCLPLRLGSLFHQVYINQSGTTGYFRRYLSPICPRHTQDAWQLPPTLCCPSPAWFAECRTQVHFQPAVCCCLHFLGRSWRAQPFSGPSGSRRPSVPQGACVLHRRRDNGSCSSSREGLAGGHVVRRRDNAVPVPVAAGQLYLFGMLR